MERLGDAINRAMNNNTVIHVFLAGCFAAMAARSYNNQQQIQALEAEKDTLVQSNKTIRNTIWNSKEHLYAAAAATPEDGNSSFVPSLSTLKVIYGEAVAVDADNQGDSKSTASTIIL